MCASTGCDKLFSLDHVKDDPPADTRIDGVQIDAGYPPDAACGTSGMTSMVLLGAREGGTGQASMADTYLIDQVETNNFGAAPTLALCAMCDAAGTPWDQSTAVSLLRFDVHAICPGSTVENAMLLLDTTTDNLGDGAVGVFMLLQAWDEGALYGTDGFANWTHRMPGNLWSAAGAGVPGSRDATALATFSPVTRSTPYQVPIPAGIVQGWVTSNATNFGLALVITQGNSDVQFHSRDSGAIASRPGLRVTVRAP